MIKLKIQVEYITKLYSKLDEINWTILKIISHKDLLVDVTKGLLSHRKKPNINPFRPVGQYIDTLTFYFLKTKPINILNFFLFFQTLK